MAKIYFVKDGPRPNNAGLGQEIQLRNLYNHMPNLNLHFLGSEPPSFNKDSASRYPLRVVVEVSASETDNNKFNQNGFYLIKGVRPNEVDLSAIS